MSVDPNLVGGYLEKVIKRGDKTSYSMVASHFGLPEFDGAWAVHPLSKIFDVLDQQDANANRPFRTSAVIGVKSNSPGPGFYEALARLKGVPDPKTPEAREKLWIEELKAAYRYSW